MQIFADKLIISKYQVYLCNTLPRLFGTNSTSVKYLKTQMFILKCYKTLLKREEVHYSLYTKLNVQFRRRISKTYHFIKVIRQYTYIHSITFHFTKRLNSHAMFVSSSFKGKADSNSFSSLFLHVSFEYKEFSMNCNLKHYVRIF